MYDLTDKNALAGSFHPESGPACSFELQSVQDIQMAVFGRVTSGHEERESLSETIRLLYKEHGMSFQSHLDGLFLIIVFDPNQNKFSIHNNRYQASEIYYAFMDDVFYFSHRMQPLLQNEKIRNEVHKGSLLNFISNGFTSCDQTQIKEIKKLLPTFTIAHSPKGFEVSNHWNEEFDFKRRDHIGDLDSELDQYEDIYQRGIKNYLSARNPKEVGTLLSGGHDTSFALIQSGKVHDRPIHGFTATFPGWAFDEAAYAKRICQKFGHTHHEVPFLPEDINYMVSLIRANDEPVVGSSLPVHLCAMEAKNHVDMMLAGDGGDTLWGEYYPVEEVEKYVSHLPYFLRHHLHGISKTMTKLTDWERFWELEHVLSLFDDKKPYDDFLRRLCTYRHYNSNELDQLFDPQFILDHRPEVSPHTLKFDKRNFGEMLIEAKLFNGFYMYQSFHTTRSMNHFDLELYLPTINRELMQFITRLPKKWVNGGTTFHRLTNNKSVNRKFHKHALARYLDRNEIYNRSFDIPWYNILRPRKALLEKLLHSLKKRGWYNDKFLDCLFKEFQTQNVKEHELLELKHHGYRIFTLLSAEVWAKEYLDSNPCKSPDQKISLEDYFG